MHRTSAFLSTRVHLLLESLRERREAGATATEYGLLVTFVAVAIVVAVTAFGTQLAAWFDRLAEAIQGWDPGGTTPPAGP